MGFLETYFMGNFVLVKRNELMHITDSRSNNTWCQ